jgi:hypothetical protein
MRFRKDGIDSIALEKASRDIFRKRKIGLHGQVERLVRTRLQFGAHCRQFDLDVCGGERRRHHEDNEQY